MGKKKEGELEKGQPELNIALVGHVDHGKCLAVDEKVLINNELISGKELIHLAKNEGQLVSQNKKESLYEVDNIYTYSLDKNLDVKRTKAQLFVQKYKGRLNCIKTRTGREIKLTESHPLLVNKEGNLFWIKSSQLEVGDHIATLRNIDLKQSKLNLPANYLKKLKEIYQLVSRKDYLYLKEKTNNFVNWDSCSIDDFDLARILIQQTKTEFGYKIGFCHTTYLWASNKKRRLTGQVKKGIINYLKKIKIPEIKKKEILFVSKQITGSKFTKFREISVDDNFIKFLAFLTAEGTSTSKRIHLCQKKYKDMRDEVFSFLDTIGLKYKQYSEKDFHFNYKAFVDYLKIKFELNLGRSREADIPCWILSLPKKQKKLFLRWFFTFEAEANNKSGQINLSQANKNNINIISYLLAEFNILTNLIVLKKCATNTREKIKRAYYSLTISGKENLKLFINTVGFNDEDKNERINQYIKRVDYKRGGKKNSTPIKVSLFNKFINNVFPEKKTLKWYNNIQEVRKKGKITDFFISELIKDSKNKKLAKEEVNYLNYLRTLSTKHLLFDEIIQINKVEYDDDLIDLVVPKFHNFFAGYGGILCHNTTLTERLSGKWTDTHSEELKKGITIRLGYADMIIYHCEKCKVYTTKEKCVGCNGDCAAVRKVSLVDAPGHESLMATMLCGAAIVDGALLLVAANEKCPQPQTREHLMALQIAGIKKVIVVQNKLDLVDHEEALKNYEQIKAFLAETDYKEALIVPVSARAKVNIEVLLEAIQEFIPTPKREEKAEPLMLVARSFDINKPGVKPKDVLGGVLGGTIKQGKLKVGEEIEILPGYSVEEKNKKVWKPLKTKVLEIFSGGSPVKEILPGGSMALATTLDPAIVKSDSLGGSLVGKPGKLPELHYQIVLETNLLKRVVGTKEEVEVKPLAKNEVLMLNVNSAATVGVITELKKKQVSCVLKKPICANQGDRVTISRRVGDRFRLIGYGVLK